MQYESDRLVEKATDLFWQRGFNATGMRDIQARLDLRPGSVYARFRSKDALFERVLGDYVKHMQATLRSVADAENPLAALRAFFVDSITTSSAHRYKRQCLLVKSLAEIDTLPAASRQTIEQGMQKLQAGFCSVVDALSAQDRLSYPVRRDLLAKWLQNQFVGLRTFASTHDDLVDTTIMIDKVLLDLQSPWPDTSSTEQHTNQLGDK
ncbi:TetR/AcrR family transcriptional regulator [Alteromonas halophila]|uniref:TetR family transcriptional regulator n=1 Tax=Alteromonas halophila TaxID=516698 RepID=A0A918JDI5_9ALTE|nr:TetR/AcrR family transcriptional regulator [Alteromonas halophila]GGW75882.1 TetR family transcriptional regulator [Alteromonas halophila]